MPVMDGAALACELAAHPENKSIPIIIMSSLPEATVKERCAAYKLFMRKPFSIFAVADQIAGVLDGQH